MRVLIPSCSALAEDMGEPPAAEVVRQGGELKDTALVPVLFLTTVPVQPCSTAASLLLTYAFIDWTATWPHCALSTVHGLGALSHSMQLTKLHDPALTPDRV